MPATQEAEQGGGSTQPGAGGLRIRNRGLVRLRPSEVLENPANFQTHPAEQGAALTAAVDAVGWFGYPDVYETADGRYMLVDGALRRDRLIEQYGDEPIDFNLTDFTEEEAAAALATKDPIAKMARVNAEAFDQLLAGLPAMGTALDEMLAAFADSSRYGYSPRWLPISGLTFHPRNYRAHPADQLQHLQASINASGFYRPVVATNAGVVLIGQGLVEAARAMGLERVPVIELELDADDPRALKLMAADNEISRLGEVDDRALSELLREIMAEDPAELVGTGFDPQQLAALVLTTRPASEISSKDHAAEWVGMPEYEEGEIPLRLVISFTNNADRKRFCKEHGLRIDKAETQTWSTRWPFTERVYVSGVRFDGTAPAAVPDPAKSLNELTPAEREERSQYDVREQPR